MMMRTVYLHGILGERYGREHHFALNCPREAVSALSANFPGFRGDFLQFPMYGVVADDECRHPGNCKDVGEFPFSRDLHLVPMIEGRLGALLTPLLIPIVGAVAAPIISGAITVGLLFGISLLLAPKPPEADDDERDENYIFSGPDNVVTQGATVPLIYGRCFVGSVVISSGLDIAQGGGENNGKGRKYSWKTQGGEVVGGDTFSPVALSARRAAPLAVPDEAEPAPAGRGPVWRPTNG
jgi:predicted phage tail protein